MRIFFDVLLKKRVKKKNVFSSAVRPRRVCVAPGVDDVAVRVGRRDSKGTRGVAGRIGASRGLQDGVLELGQPALEVELVSHVDGLAGREAEPLLRVPRSLRLLRMEELENPGNRGRSGCVRIFPLSWLGNENGYESLKIGELGWQL